ncbi:MAG TPA: ankyrin repeat domain-containing protein, partial [Gammaproteobacteria bacterium]|nr:ankyrin repeat domain-containing protein [Gammaproteobacteria bacterium]
GKSAAVLLGVVFEMKERPTEVDIVINNINEAIEKLKLAASQNKERFKLEVKAQGQGQAQLSFIAPPHEIPVLINLHYDESKELEAKKAKVEDMYCYSPQKIFLTYTERGYLDETTEFILQEIVKKHPEHLLPAKYPLEQTPLHYALKADYLGAAEELILHGASITQADATGRKPIDYTSDASFREFLQMAEDKQYNAAHIAAINGRTDVIPYLAKQNLLNAFDKNGFTPAHLAISKNNLNMLQKLTESKAIISPTKKGMSPLAIAIQQNNAPIVDFLIKNGESVTVTTSKGEEPLYKFAKPNSETFNLLKEAYAKGATRSKEFKKNG